MTTFEAASALGSSVVAVALGSSSASRSPASDHAEAPRPPFVVGGAAAEADDDDDDFFGHDGLPKSLLDSCLKLEVTHCEPNYSLPWQMRHQTSSTSTGFIISGERILTNAHCVDNFRGRLAQL